MLRRVHRGNEEGYGYRAGSGGLRVKIISFFMLLLKSRRFREGSRVQGTGRPG